MRKFINLIRPWNTRFWDKVITNTIRSDESLAIFRWIFGFYSLILFTPYYSWISSVPPGLFDPPLFSIAYLFDSFPGGIAFVLSDYICLIAILCITIGVKARLFTVILLLVKIFCLSFFFSFGKIDHNILENILLLCMIFSNWGSNYALIPDKKFSEGLTNKALSLLAVFICFGMFSAGILKLVIWIDFDFKTSGFLTWYYRGYFNLGRTNFLAPYILELPRFSFELFDYLAALFEVSGFIMLLKSRKSWFIWLMVACFFHLSNTLILNIPFLEHSIVYAAFLNFSSKKIEPNKINIILKRVAFSAPIILFMLHIVFKLNGTASGFFLGTEYENQIILKLYFGVFIWISLILFFAIQLKKIKIGSLQT